MPTIVLSEPFIRHYAGTIFTVSDAIGVSGWDDDDRLREKQSCYDQRVYLLPDDGKGTPAELPLPYAFDCPEHLLSAIDIKSGPCRITSVSKSLEKVINDPYYASPLPLGKGKITYLDTENYAKNGLFFDVQNEDLSDKANIINSVTDEIKTIYFTLGKSLVLTFDEFEPGFYTIDMFQSNLILHHFTLIKCFPIVVTLTDIRYQYRVSPTLW